MSRLNGHSRARARLAASNSDCHYCGAPATTVDHVVPLSVGGTSAQRNTVPACRPCNEEKGASALPNHCTDCAAAWDYMRELRGVTA